VYYFFLFFSDSGREKNLILPFSFILLCKREKRRKRGEIKREKGSYF